MTAVRLLARAGVIALVPALLTAQGQPTGVITGRVMAVADTGANRPVQGATIAVRGTTHVASSRADGRFLLAGVPDGVRAVRVRLLGYQSAERAVRVIAGDTVRVEFALQPEAHILAAISTDALPTDVEAFVTKPNVGTIALTARSIAAIPAVGEPDVIRTMQFLPGVVARNDFNTGLNVRGGEADQNLILLDGYPIYNPFHLGGLFSTFMDATVGGIELMTGAFPARFGGRLSSVLDVRSMDETRCGIHGSADISALGATGRLAGTVGAGRGTWSLAGRRTYADAATSIFTDNIFPYHFRDVHGRATYAFPGGVRVAVTGYAGKDVLDANLAEFDSDTAPSRAGRGEWAFDWGNRLLGVSIGRDFGDRITLEQRFSSSAFSTLLDLGDGAYAQRNSISDLRAAGTFTARGTTHDRRIGYEVAAHRIGYGASSAETGTVGFDLVQRPITAAAYADDLWRLSSRWLVEGGLRAEALTGRQWAALSPRLSVKYFATPGFALTVAAGRMTQVLHSLAGDGPLRYFEIWIASDSLTPVATAWHWVAGAERRVRNAGSVRLEGYVKRYDRLLEANRPEDPQRRGDALVAAEGLSYGFDVLARWLPPTGATGWIAYSYGLSSRSRDGARWAPGHDRRHDLDVVTTWRLAKYRLGARFGFATGTPYTPIVGEIARRQYDPSRDHWGTGDPRIFVESLGGPRNGMRFPATHRLDLSASREYRTRGATVAPYLSVVNAYNAKSVFVYLYNYSTDTPTRRAISQFPVLPSLGVRIGF